MSVVSRSERNSRAGSRIVGVTSAILCLCSLLGGAWICRKTRITLLSRKKNQLFQKRTTEGNPLIGDDHVVPGLDRCRTYLSALTAEFRSNIPVQKQWLFLFTAFEHYCLGLEVNR